MPLDAKTDLWQAPIVLQELYVKMIVVTNDCFIKRRHVAN